MSSIVGARPDQSHLANGRNTKRVCSSAVRPFIAGLSENVINCLAPHGWVVGNTLNPPDMAKAQNPVRSATQAAAAGRGFSVLRGRKPETSAFEAEFGRSTTTTLDSNLLRRTGLAQTSDAIAIFPLLAGLEESDAFEPLEDVSLGSRGADGA